MPGRRKGYCASQTVGRSPGQAEASNATAIIIITAISAFMVATFMSQPQPSTWPTQMCKTCFDMQLLCRWRQQGLHVTEWWCERPSNGMAGGSMEFCLASPAFGNENVKFLGALSVWRYPGTESFECIAAVLALRGLPMGQPTCDCEAQYQKPEAWT